MANFMDVVYDRYPRGMTRERRARRDPGLVVAALEKGDGLGATAIVQRPVALWIGEL
jgi:hypothetical protein